MVIDRNAIIAAAMKYFHQGNNAFFVRPGILDYIEKSIISMFSEIYGEDIIFISEVNGDDYILYNEVIYCPHEKRDYSFDDIYVKYRIQTANNPRLYYVLFNSEYIDVFVKNYYEYEFNKEIKGCDQDDKEHKLILNISEC